MPSRCKSSRPPLRKVSRTSSGIEKRSNNASGVVRINGRSAGVSIRCSINAWTAASPTGEQMRFSWETPGGGLDGPGTSVHRLSEKPFDSRAEIGGVLDHRPVATVGHDVTPAVFEQFEKTMRARQRRYTILLAVDDQHRMFDLSQRVFGIVERSLARLCIDSGERGFGGSIHRQVITI